MCNGEYEKWLIFRSNFPFATSIMISLKFTYLLWENWRMWTVSFTLSSNKMTYDSKVAFIYSRITKENHKRFRSQRLLVWSKLNCCDYDPCYLYCQLWCQKVLEILETFKDFSKVLETSKIFLKNILQKLGVNLSELYCEIG